MKVADQTIDHRVDEIGEVETGANRGNHDGVVQVSVGVIVEIVVVELKQAAPVADQYRGSHEEVEEPVQYLQSSRPDHVRRLLSS